MKVAVRKKRKSELRESRPLTLDEVRQAQGSVWICYPQETWGSQSPDKTALDCSRCKFNFEDYGKTWIAFNEKPEQMSKDVFRPYTDDEIKLALAPDEVVIVPNLSSFFFE